jgi:hypothetical protein
MILPHVLGFSSHLSIPLYCTLKSYMFIFLRKNHRFFLGSKRLFEAISKIEKWFEVNDGDES